MALWSGKKASRLRNCISSEKPLFRKRRQNTYLLFLPSLNQGGTRWFGVLLLDFLKPRVLIQLKNAVDEIDHTPAKNKLDPLIQSIEVAKSTLGKMTFHLVNRSALDALNGLVSLVSSTPTTAVKKNWEPQLTLCSSLHSIPIAIMYSRVAPVSVINQRRNAFLFQQKAEKTAIFNAVWRCFLW